MHIAEYDGFRVLRKSGRGHAELRGYRSTPLSCSTILTPLAPPRAPRLRENQALHMPEVPCLDDLVARGVRAPVFCIIDGNPGLRRAIGEVCSQGKTRPRWR